MSQVFEVVLKTYFAEDATLDGAEVHTYLPVIQDATQVQHHKRIGVPTGTGAAGGVAIDLVPYNARCSFIVKNIGSYKMLVRWTPVDNTADFAGMTASTQYCVLNPGTDAEDGELCVITGVAAGGDINLFSVTDTGYAQLTVVDV